MRALRRRLAGKELCNAEAGGADENVVGVPLHPTSSNERAGEEQRLVAAVANVRFDPEEELDGHLVAALLAARYVKITDLILDGLGDLLGGQLERLDIDRFQLALANPA
ncbi:MAG: hypothetical protein WBQ14_09470 [Gaiellaceae bacterium]